MRVRVKVGFRVATQCSLLPFDTDAEEAFYNLVRKIFPGTRLVNQFPVKGFRLDFFFPDAWLAVEVDGPIHGDRQIEDLERDASLKDFGIQTVRFTNEEVFESAPFVIETMSRLLNTKPAANEPQHQKELSNAPH
jgi:very-short-patch-repair endonuclease